jgi:L-lactate dehydrogenase complex protein LldE
VQRTVALFITCLTDQFYPRVGVAVVKVLEKLGWRVEYPGSQSCCGQPFYNNGFRDDARDLASRFVEIFEPFEYIVTPSASCCSMVRQHFSHLLGERAATIRSRTYEFVEFLQNVVKFDPSQLSLPREARCTYHYVCHQRLLGRTSEAEVFLRKLGNVRFSPLEKADQCCGFGGTFAAKFPQISRVMRDDKIACISRTDADVLVCNDAGCAMNIAAPMQMQTKHIAELLAEAMGLSLDAL